jgi:hypothetical protein
MNAQPAIIKVTAAELLHGDDNNGEIVDHVDVQGAKTFVFYINDDSRYRVASDQVYTVARVGGVSTVADAPVATTVRPNHLVIDAHAGAVRERLLRNDLRNEHRRLYGR